MARLSLVEQLSKFEWQPTNVMGAVRCFVKSKLFKYLQDENLQVEIAGSRLAW